MQTRLLKKEIELANLDPENNKNIGKFLKPAKGLTDLTSNSYIDVGKAIIQRLTNINEKRQIFLNVTRPWNLLLKKSKSLFEQLFSK